MNKYIKDKNFLNNQNYIGSKKERDFVEKQFIKGILFKYRIYAVLLMLLIIGLSIYIATSTGFLNFLNEKVLYIFYSDYSSLETLNNIHSNSLLSGRLNETYYIFIGIIIIIYIFFSINYVIFYNKSYNYYLGKYIIYNKNYKSYIGYIWNTLISEPKYIPSYFSFTINKEIKSDNIIADNGAYIIKLKNNHE